MNQYSSNVLLNTKSQIIQLNYNQQTDLFIIYSSELRVIHSFSTQLSLSSGKSLPSIQNCIFQISQNYNQISSIELSAQNVIEQQYVASILISPSFNSILPQLPYEFSSLELLPQNKQIPILNLSATTLSSLNTTFTSISNFLINVQSNMKMIQLGQEQSDNKSGYLSLNNIIITGKIANSSIYIPKMNIVIIRQAKFLNLTLSNTTLFHIYSANVVIFHSLFIYNVTLLDSFSKIISVSSSTRVIFTNLTIIASVPNLSQLINVKASKLVEFQSTFITSNYFLPFSSMTPSNFRDSPPIVILISGCVSTSFNNLIIKNNIIATPLYVSPNYIIDSLSTTNHLTTFTASNIVVFNNTNSLLASIQIEAYSVQLNNITATKNLQGNGNGTIYISQANLYMQESRIYNNSAYSGSAVYLNQTVLAQFYLCDFQNNTAIAAGGAILAAKTQIILNKTIIQLNSGMVGGGIRIENGWSSYLNQDIYSAVKNNTASLYGNNVASKLQTMKIYLNSQLMQLTSDETFYPLQKQWNPHSSLPIVNSYDVFNIRSGVEITILIQLFDEDGRIFIADTNLVSAAPTIKLELKQMASILRSNQATLLGENQISDYSMEKQGYYSEGLIIQGYPSSDMPLFLVQNFIENSERIPSSKINILRVLKDSIVEHSQSIAYEHQKLCSNATASEIDYQLSLSQQNHRRLLKKVSQFTEYEGDEIDIFSILEQFQLQYPQITLLLHHCIYQSGNLFEECLINLKNFLYLNLNKNQYQVDSQGFHNYLQPRQLVEITALLSIFTSLYVQIVAFRIYFRDCINGEIHQVINEQKNITVCVPCPIYSYTLSHNATDCLKCPDSAFLCQNSTIILNDGFWRESNNTDEIYECDQSLNSCMSLTLRDKNQPCKEGFTGPKCQGCDTFGELSGFKYTLHKIGGECLRCQVLSMQIFYFILTFVLTSLYLLFCVEVAILNTTNFSITQYVRMLGFAAISQSSMRDVSSQYIKVLVHYLQLFSVINSINIQLPAFVGNISSYTGNPGTTLLLSSGCLIAEMQIKGIMQTRVILSSLLPIIYCLSVLFISFILSCLKIYKFSKQFFLTTIIFIFMFFQPDCVMFLLSSIGCNKLTNNSYLLADANYQCYTDESYRSFMYSYGIPALIIWSVTPLIVLYFLYRRRNHLNLISTKQRFGYLFLEYKQDHYYFDFLRCFLKIIVVIFQTLSTAPSQFKYTCIVILISLYLVYLNRTQPFLHKNLQNSDNFTHIILLATIFLNSITDITSSARQQEILQNAALLLNGFYVGVIILIIASLKIHKFDSVISNILQFAQQRFGKKCPCFLKIHFRSAQSRSLAQKQWKWVYKQLPIILNGSLAKQMMKRSLISQQAIIQMKESNSHFLQPQFAKVNNMPTDELKIYSKFFNSPHLKKDTQYSEILRPQESKRSMIRTDASPIDDESIGSPKLIQSCELDREITNNIKMEQYSNNVNLIQHLNLLNNSPFLSNSGSKVSLKGQPHSPLNENQFSQFKI